MLQIHDIRESRVYQDAMREGIEKGRIKGKEEGRMEGIEFAIAKLAAKNTPATEIADILSMDLALVLKAIEKKTPSL